MCVSDAIRFWHRGASSRSTMSRRPRPSSTGCDERALSTAPRRAATRVTAVPARSWSGRGARHAAPLASAQDDARACSSCRCCTAASSSRSRIFGLTVAGSTRAARHGGSPRIQCGYCTPGVVMSLWSMVERAAPRARIVPGAGSPTASPATCAGARDTGRSSTPGPADVRRRAARLDPGPTLPALARVVRTATSTIERQAPSSSPR